MSVDRGLPDGWRCTHTDGEQRCPHQGFYRPTVRDRNSIDYGHTDFTAPLTCYLHRPTAPSDWPKHNREERGVLPGHHCSGCNDPDHHHREVA